MVSSDSFLTSSQTIFCLRISKYLTTKYSSIDKIAKNEFLTMILIPNLLIFWSILFENFINLEK